VLVEFALGVSVAQAAGARELLEAFIYFILFLSLMSYNSNTTNGESPERETLPFFFDTHTQHAHSARAEEANL